MEQMMEAPREHQLAAQALAKRDKRQAAAFGKGSTSGAVALAGQQLPRLTEYLRAKWQTPARANAPEYHLERMLRQLDPEIVALVCLQTGLHIAAHHTKRQVETFKVFADNLEAECYYHGLFKSDKKLAGRANAFAAKQAANGNRRRQVARAVASKAGFIHEQWSAEERTIAGVWCANLLTEGLPEVFEWTEFVEWDKKLGVPHKYRMLAVTEAANSYMREAVRDLIQRRPVWLPRLTPPEEWTGFKSKPSENARILKHVSLVKTYNKDQQAAIRRALADGSMAPTLKGINALQSVPYQINSWLLGVMDEVLAKGINVPGFTVADKVELPAKLTDDEWAALSKEQKRLLSEERATARTMNRQRASDITLLALDLEEAHRLAAAEEFYLPMTMDSRGRVYPLPRFNFQRGDTVRSLFLFKRGAPITEKGTYWLSVHVANCWAQKGPDGIGLDKKPFDERVKWVNDNAALIRWTAENPTDPIAVEFWTQADSPWMFLAACREWRRAWINGPSMVSHLPVSFDGSCSGLQHLAGMMRAPEGQLVNLTDNAYAEDIYSIVADVAKRIIEADATGQDEQKRKYAQLFLSYPGGIDRKLLKRNCMTFCYSSEATGMGDQQFEDLMVPLQSEAIRTNTPHHFGTVKEQAAAARYMGRVAYAAITEVVKKPAEAMDFLKALAGAMAHEGKPVRWVTPAGLPCVNRYHNTTTKKLQLWLHNERINVTVAVADAPPILKRKCQQAIAPNFVHSMDAAHLLLTAGACADEGIIDIATVHDSFGCLPAHADRFNQIVREQFLKMYQEHDVLTYCRSIAEGDLTEANHWRLPPLPEFGSLDLSEVLRAKYAFA